MLGAGASRIITAVPKPTPSALSISKDQARRFLILHHKLAPPRKLQGKQGVLDYIRHVNCIQYDPINVVGQNPHLVLQSRIKGYKPSILDQALYSDRRLVDGFDKVMSIYPIEDWPYFKRYRERLGKQYANHANTVSAKKLMKWALAEIRDRGPLSALDLEDDTRMDWWLTNTARSARIALDILFIAGEIMVHHRVGTRRYFDLPNRTIPAKLHSAPNPHKDHRSYVRWHVLRRVGGLGLASPAGGGEHWGGLDAKGDQKRQALAELEHAGEILRVVVDNQPKQPYFIRRTDLPVLEAAAKPLRGKPGAAFLAPLDNFMWNRDRLEDIFDFFYRWEVYVPEAKRQYGYYVLPVLYGDRLIARLDPALDRASSVFTIKNWWWQPGVAKKDEAMLAALQECVAAFAKYLGAKDVKLGEVIKRDKVLREIIPR